MEELAQLDCLELEVPHLTEFDRIKYLKVLACKLPFASPDHIDRWLMNAGAGELVKRLAEAAKDRRQLLFLSAGSFAAPYCLALSKKFSGKSCAVMTPSVFGTKPFDMAIVPKHDDKSGDNILVTLGAPNTIYKDILAKSKDELLADYPPQRKEAWGVLIGGDDRNYSITPKWVDDVMPILLTAAEKSDVDLYITTSRRTFASAEHEISKLCSGNKLVRMLLLASKDPRNPVPGMLGHCSTVFCTEDSVSMISESVTASARVFVIAAERCGGVKRFLQQATKILVESKLLPMKYLWGVPRFDRMIGDFEEHGYLTRVNPENLAKKLDERDGQETRPAPLNEAERAAKWILSRWLGRAV